MTRVWRRLRPVHVGIALGPDRLVAAIPGAPPGASWTHVLTPPTDLGVSRDLPRALGILRAIVENAGRSSAVERDGAGAAPAGVLHVAVLPPLGHLTRLALPRARSGEALRRVRQESSRYLPCWSNAGPLEIELAPDTWRSASTFTLFAAPRALVEGIHEAAQSSGWRVAKIASAHGAWAASATSLLLRRTGPVLVACLDDRVDILRVRHGRLTTLRRLPARAPNILSLVEATLAQVVGDRLRARFEATIVGDSPLATALAARLGASNGSGLPVRASSLLEDPAITAARFARRAAPPVLYSEQQHTIQTQQSRRRRTTSVAVAGVLIGLAGAAESWAVDREQGSVDRARAAHRELVARAVATRDSVSSLTQRVALLRQASSTAPRWSSLILMLADRLPQDAMLTALQADEETINLEGSAIRAASVLEAVRQLPGVRAVRFAGPIRQDAKDGVITEQFVLVATLGGQP